MKTSIRWRRMQLQAVAVFWGCNVIAQPWSPVVEHQLDIVPTDASIAMVLDGDLLVVGISEASGGVVRILARNAGGLDQWGTIATINGTGPWFGKALALRDGLLAIGVPGAAGNGPFTGEVRIFDVDPGDLMQPVTDRDTLRLPDATANDRFGYSLLWIGDTLAASAVSRASFRSSGAVFFAVDDPPDFSIIGQLPFPADDPQVPFHRWFGAALATDGERIAVAAPFSGFRPEVAQENIGSLHLFRRDVQAPLGWSLDTLWSDPRPHGNMPCAFERIELGRRGLAFGSDRLFFDHSTYYDGAGGNGLEPWQDPDPAALGCERCGVRIAEQMGSAWGLDVAQAPSQDPAFWRGVDGWTVYDEALFVEWFNPTDSSWTTSVHSRDQDGPGNWGVEADIAELDPCDDLRGPLVANNGVLVRTSLRRGTDCGIAAGLMAVQLQFFLP